MERIDVRKFTVEGRNLLRQMVLRLRQQSGMRVEDLAKVSGAHPSTIRGWLAQARREEGKSLEERPRGRPVGACRKLPLADEVWLREQIIGQTPRQMKLPFALWTRPAIRALVKERLGIGMQDRLIGKYLKRWSGPGPGGRGHLLGR